MRAMLATLIRTDKYYLTAINDEKRETEFDS
jgi:hypothetical protein